MTDHIYVVFIQKLLWNKVYNLLAYYEWGDFMHSENVSGGPFIHFT